MEQDKELKDLVNKMFMEKAPVDFEDNLLSKIDALVEKPLPVYEPIIPRKFWLILFGVLVAGVLAVKLFTTPMQLDTSFIDTYIENLRSVSMTWMLVPLVPLLLYFIDIYREYRFNLNYQVA